MSNKSIREFTIDENKKIDYVNALDDKQMNKMDELMKNNISESVKFSVDTESIDAISQPPIPVVVNGDLDSLPEAYNDD